MYSFSFSDLFKAKLQNILHFFLTSCFDDRRSVHMVVLNWQTKLIQKHICIGKTLGIYLFQIYPFRGNSCMYEVGKRWIHLPYSECHLCWGVNILIFPQGRWCHVLHSSELPTGILSSIHSMDAGETWSKTCFHTLCTQSFQDQIPSVARFVCWVGKAYWMKLANLKKMWYVRMTQEMWKQISCRCYRRPDFPFWGDIDDTNPNKY